MAYELDEFVMATAALTTGLAVTRMVFHLTGNGKSVRRLVKFPLSDGMARRP